MAVQELICELFKLGASCYSLPIDKLLIEYLLVPSVLAIIFIYIASSYLLRGISLKIKSLVSIILYIVLVHSGLYGIFASFAYSYVVLFVIIGMGLFFLERLVAKEWVSGGAKGAGEIIKKLSEKKKELPTEENLYDLVDLYNHYRERMDFYDNKQKEAYDEGYKERARELSRKRDQAEDNMQEAKLKLSYLVRKMGGIDRISDQNLREKVKKILEQK